MGPYRRRLDQAAAAFAGALLLALLGTVTLGIITRGMGDPLIWTDEASRLLMVWLAAFGWIVATRRRGHVRVRFFQNLVPPAPRRVIERAIQLLLLALGATIAWFGAALVLRNADLEALTMPISMAWFYIPLVPAGTVMALQAAVEIRHPASPSAAALVE